MRVRDILAEPIRNFGLAKDAADLEKRVGDLMDRVRLPRDAVNRWPHEFSGGQRQRIGIARALAAEPDLIICDEAVSALDVSVKAQIVNLLQDLQKDLGLALLFISHDLAIVEHMTHRVAVMYLGKIVEVAPKRELFAAPKHPYTEALLSAVPVPEPGAQRERVILTGDVPSPINPPKGCRFHTRCPYAFDRCRQDEPALRQTEPGHWAACHLHDRPAAENPLAGAKGAALIAKQAEVIADYAELFIEVAAASVLQMQYQAAVSARQRCEMGGMGMKAERVEVPIIPGEIKPHDLQEISASMAMAVKTMRHLIIPRAEACPIPKE
jgi:peptide/nickel transport system ATP-binding protein